MQPQVFRGAFAGLFRRLVTKREGDVLVKIFMIVT